MTALRRDLPELPPRMRKLPIDERGYPVPAFVAWVDGKPDHRIVDGRFARDALRFRLCWLCREPLGRHGAFVIGPMCAVNRISAEGPSHLECGDFAARSCPFMTRPAAKRREHGVPEAAENPGGNMIRRNPGVICLWVTSRWREINDGKGGRLVTFEDPTVTRWYREGRFATREEVEASVASGCPLLEEEARQHPMPDLALAELARMRKAAEAFWPAAEAA